MLFTIIWNVVIVGLYNRVISQWGPAIMCRLQWLLLKATQWNFFFSEIIRKRNIFLGYCMKICVFAYEIHRKFRLVFFSKIIWKLNKNFYTLYKSIDFSNTAYDRDDFWSRKPTEQIIFQFTCATFSHYDSPFCIQIFTSEKIIYYSPTIINPIRPNKKR